MIKVTAEFQTYWQISTGRGAGYFMDSVIDKDLNDLPYVSGKSLKGIFRSAVEKIDTWQPNAKIQPEVLFGSASHTTQRDNTEAGALLFSNLQLSEIEIQQLNQNPLLKSLLTQAVSSTKIDENTGVAEDKSLRTQQVAVPLILQGEISLSDQASVSLQEAFNQLNQAASLVTHIGTKKSRGYGQVNLILTLNNQEKG